MVYFDNAATTKVFNDVAKSVENYMVNDYANPSSMHKFGLSVEKKIKNAQKYIADFISSPIENILYTSGATESNNMAILSVASRYPNAHFITTKIEHPSVLSVYRHLEDLGHEVFYLDVDKNGIVSIADILNNIQENTKLISLIYVNNEIGSIQPIKDIVSNLNAVNYKGEVHIDATQYFGKFLLNMKELKVDYLSASAHKVHGPKGIGLLYCRNIKNLRPLLHGGGQQNDYRSGTLNTTGIVGFAKAISLINGSINENLAKLTVYRKMVYDYSIKNSKYCELIGTNDRKFSPYINSLHFFNISSEILLHSLEEYGIMVASGSACSTKKTILSHVLSAIDGDRYKNGAIRISFSSLNTEDELKFFFETLDKIVPELERYTNVKK